MTTFLLLFLSLFLRLIGLEPIAVYLTLPEQPVEGMTVCWIQSGEAQTQEFKFRNRQEEVWFEPLEVLTRPCPTLPYTHHSVSLRGLKSNQLYEFAINSKTYSFKTLPLSFPLTFVVGGDVYHDSMRDLVKITRIAARKDPDFVLLGGDIAYSGYKFSFFNESGARWIEFLSHFSKSLVREDGSLIPFTAAIGNHDVNGRFGQTPHQAAWFYFLFPTPQEGGRILDFGSLMSLWILDSGHSHPVAGQQTAWLDRTLEERKAVPWKCALYHVPAYPSVRAFNNPHSFDVRTHWVPFFDKHRLNLAFENHEHAYKRTHLLRGGKIDPEGVLYMGDGAFGVAAPRNPYKPSQRKYLAQSASEQHFIFVTLKEDSFSIEGVNAQGVVFDSFTK